MELLYVIEPHEMPREPGNRDAPTKSSDKTAGDYITFGLAATALTGAITGAGLTLGKVIYDKVREDPKEEADPRDSNFIRKYGVTEELARDLGFHFEPGHPQLHHLYREHPLAKIQGDPTEKAGVFFSMEKYEDTLKEERKAELVRILIELGAVRIEIAEESSNQSNTATSMSFGAQGKAGGGEAGIGSSGRQESRNSAKEVSTSAGERRLAIWRKRWRPTFVGPASFIFNRCVRRFRQAFWRTTPTNLAGCTT